MNSTLDSILTIEWEFFQAVHNKGGRALCQDSPRTFDRMRRSQFLPWPQTLQQSYLQDLLEAKSDKHNMLSEKYARMMSYTHPLEYTCIEVFLPPVCDNANKIIEKLLPIFVHWQKEFCIQYPKLASRSRPIIATSEKNGDTSFEIYLRCELMTYSLKTLLLLQELVECMQTKNSNMSIQVMKHTVALYGYPSLAAAEAVC